MYVIEAIDVLINPSGRDCTASGGGCADAAMSSLGLVCHIEYRVVTSTPDAQQARADVRTGARVYQSSSEALTMLFHSCELHRVPLPILSEALQAAQSHSNLACVLLIIQHPRTCVQ